MPGKNTFKELIDSLLDQGRETEWLEFKRDNDHPQLIGEYISALANSACLCNEPYGYLVYGIDNESLAVVGTNFQPHAAKGKGNEGLEPWLARQLSPRNDFRIETGRYDDLPVVVFRIEATFQTPVSFKNIAYIRVGEHKHKLRDHPEKERKIWKKGGKSIFEKGIALRNQSGDQVLSLIDYPAFFDLLGMNICEERGSGIDRAIDAIEVFQLPAPEFQGEETFTRVTLFAHKELRDMDRKDKIRACYQHCCLRWVCRDLMTNSSLRKRFGIDDRNYSMASRIIRSTLDDGLIKVSDPENKSNKKKYVPFWI